MDALVRRRRRRLVRESRGRRLNLSARDISIFRLLHRFRYLRSTFLCAFFPEANRTGLIKRLGALFHEGWLDRPVQQYHYANALYLPAVYALNARSAAALRQLGKSDDVMVREGLSPGVHRQFAHALMIADVLASIELGTRQAPVRFISATEIISKAPCRTLQHPLRLRVSVSHAGRTSEVAVVPDALFGLAYEGIDGSSYRFFALEADRNTMPVRRAALRQSSYLRKLLAYREVLAQGLHCRHFGIPNLLILTVTVSETHRVSLMQALNEITGGKGSPVFLFKTMSTLGDGLAAPPPAPHMLFEPWQRQGFPPLCIAEAS